MFSGFFNPLMATDAYTHEEEIDIAIYVILMLELVKGFRILELHVEKD